MVKPLETGGSGVSAAPMHEMTASIGVVALVGDDERAGLGEVLRRQTRGAAGPCDRLAVDRRAASAWPPRPARCAASSIHACSCVEV